MGRPDTARCFSTSSCHFLTYLRVSSMRVRNTRQSRALGVPLVVSPWTICTFTVVSSGSNTAGHQGRPVICTYIKGECIFHLKVASFASLLSHEYASSLVFHRSIPGVGDHAIVSRLLFQICRVRAAPKNDRKEYQGERR